VQTKEDKGLSLLDRTIFTYSISHLSSSDKVRFYYALKGRTGDTGIISELEITQLGKTVLLCDTRHDKLLSGFLSSWGCKYSYLPITVGEGQPTTQPGSRSDTIGTIQDEGIAGRTIFTYALTHLSNSDKVRFYYALKGRTGDTGIISELEITQLGKTVLMCDQSHDKLLSEFLSSWGCKYSYLPISIRGEQPTTQTASTPLDEIGTILWEDSENLAPENTPAYPQMIEGLTPLTASIGRNPENESKTGRSVGSTRIAEALTLRQARTLIGPTPKYPLKMGTVNRISLRTEKTQSVKSRRAPWTATPVDASIRRRQEHIDTLIERQVGIRTASPEGLEWLSVNSLPAIEDTDEMHSVQERALIRQERQYELYEEQELTGLDGAQEKALIRQKRPAKGHDKTATGKTNLSKDIAARKDRSERIDDNMEVRRTP